MSKAGDNGITVDQDLNDEITALVDRLFEKAKKEAKEDEEMTGNAAEKLTKTMPGALSREFMGIVKQKMPMYNENEQRAIAAAFSEIRKAGWVRTTTGWTQDEEPGQVFKRRVDITKVNEEKRLVFGWGLVAFDPEGLVTPEEFINEDGQVVDHQGDLVDEDELEQMAYNFVLHYREGGEMHVKGGSATLVESVVFTQEKQDAMGIPEGILPIGWWLGFHVEDDDAWEAVKNGDYAAFSIEGTAIREPVETE